MTQKHRAVPLAQWAAAGVVVAGMTLAVVAWVWPEAATPAAILFTALVFAYGATLRDDVRRLPGREADRHDA